jgi:acyl-CoA thioester hydrolase
VKTPARPKPLGREAYARFVTVTSRWGDNDSYGHINNSAYYFFFDSAINGLLVEAGLLDPATSDVIGLAASNACDYFSSLAFPDLVEIGVAVEAIGSSSVRYRVGAFKAGAALAAAQGHFVHVYVRRVDQRPVPIPSAHRFHMDRLRIEFLRARESGLIGAPI